MGASDPRIDRYLAKDRPWRDEMAALREIALSEGLIEALKWRSPCYLAQGGNVAMIGALSEAAFMSFFKGVLLDDPEGLLVPPGPNSRSARVFRVTSVAEVVAAEPALRVLIRQAVQNGRAGRRVTFEADNLEWPAEFMEVLAADPDLAEAFGSLTPGRRRGYVLHISQAKQPDTRRTHIAKWRPRILEGRGMHDR